MTPQQSEAKARGDKSRAKLNKEKNMTMSIKQVQSEIARLIVELDKSDFKAWTAGNQADEQFEAAKSCLSTAATLLGLCEHFEQEELKGQ